MLIFARLGTVMGLLPAIGDKSILPRAKLSLGMTVSLVIYPMLEGGMPLYPASAGVFAQLLIGEILIGLFLGLTVKIMFLALSVVGLIISMQSGLGSAMFFDPSQKEQVPIFSRMIFLIATMTIFVTDTHYVFLEGAIESYDKFPVGQMPDIGDMSNFISRSINDSFILAFKLVSPFLIVSIAILAGSGILARLMPNLQVFFVLTPVQILAMFITFFIVIHVMLDKLMVALREAAMLQL
ncbi:MAG: flagellar biosynthetic protein FliR [Pseudomonadota bacterium]